MDVPEQADEQALSECGQQLRNWMTSCQENGNAVRESAASAVVEWKWSRFWMWHPAPFWFQRGGYPKGKAFRTAPESPEYHHFQTGFDAEGRVRVERSYIEIVRDSKRWYSETVVQHEADQILSARFDHSPEKKLNGVSCCLLRDGLVRLECNTAPAAANSRIWFKQFDWRTPGELRVYNGSQEGPDRPFEMAADVVIVSLDVAGRPLSVRKEVPGRETWIQWVRPKKGTSIAALGHRVTQALKQRIIQTLRTWKAPGPAYCVAISYDDEGNDVFLPSLGVGLESERSAWAAEGTEKLKRYMWNPAEFANYASAELDPELPGLEEDVRMLNQLVMEKDAGEKAVRLVRRMARELATEVDWPSVMDVTDDFMVFCVGLELSQLEADLKACLGTARFKALQRGGLIH